MTTSMRRSMLVFSILLIVCTTVECNRRPGRRTTTTAPTSIRRNVQRSGQRSFGYFDYDDLFWPECPSGQWQCDYGPCIPSHFLNDGIVDCCDCSDERDGPYAHKCDDVDNTPTSTTPMPTTTTKEPPQCGIASAAHPPKLAWPADLVFPDPGSRTSARRRQSSARRTNNSGRSTDRAAGRQRLRAAERRRTPGGTRTRTSAQQSRRLGKARVDNGIVARAHSWPWQVYLSSGCGGVIVADDLVVTAAHCGNHSAQVTVYAGLHDTRLKKDAVLRTGSLIHHSKSVADIAYIKISPKFQFNDKIRPVCMPEQMAKADAKCFVTGWGIDYKKDGKSKENYLLTQARQLAIAQSKCKDYGGGPLSHPEHYMCAVGPKTLNHADSNEPEWNHESSCYGDSGGPLVCLRPDNTFELQGIVSTGSKWGCGSDATGTENAIYAKVISYKQWIEAASDQL